MRMLEPQSRAGQPHYTFRLARGFRHVNAQRESAQRVTLTSLVRLDGIQVALPESDQPPLGATASHGALTCARSLV